MASRAPVSRSTTVTTPTTSASASRAARTAVSTDAPVVEVSSTTRTRRPVMSGPSISRCIPCCFADFRTTNASTGGVAGSAARSAAAACSTASATGSAPRVSPPTAEYSQSAVSTRSSRPTSGAARCSSVTRRRST